jgi:hypothetical protein
MIRVAIINDTRPTHHYGCMLVMENLFRLLLSQGVEVVWTWPVGTDWRKHKRKILTQPKVDAFIVNGEGTIHHSADRKHAKSLSEFALFATDKLNTPSFLINATLYKNEKSLYGFLSHYKLIYVRDKESLVELESFGINGKYVPDLTFAKAKKHKKLAVKKGCVIDTALKSEIPILKEYSLQNEFDFRSMVVARPSNANFFKSPRPFVKNVIKWLKTDRHISTNPDVFIRYLLDYKMVVTGRYHAVTICLKNKIPLVAIESNTPKITRVLQESLGSSERVVSFDSLKSLDLNLLDKYTDQELAKLDDFIKSAEEEIQKMIDSIVIEINRALET